MQHKNIHFNIQHLDSLGQGVFKTDTDVFFIKKTLPLEKGEASFMAKSKGVHFYKLEQIHERSHLRQDSPCPHFEQCGGCDFLHTSYESELDFKKNALMRMVQKLPIKKPEITVHRAPDRLHYRNRIQLHYDKSKKQIGFLSVERKILDTRQCQILNNDVEKTYQRLLENDYWLKLVEQAPKTGHIEIYHNKISVNKPYAEGGFSQVYEQMNQVLKTLIAQKISNELSQKNYLIDLFGGNGNLSDQLPFAFKWVVDFYPKVPESSANVQFTNQDLYDAKAISTLKKTQDKLKFFECDLMLIDPPRSGLKNINEFLMHFFPKKAVYVACQASSLVRDLSTLHPQYEIEEIHLVDLFPSTHHFETIAFISRKDC